MSKHCKTCLYVMTSNLLDPCQSCHDNSHYIPKDTDLNLVTSMLYEGEDLYIRQIHKQRKGNLIVDLEAKIHR